MRKWTTTSQFIRDLLQGAKNSGVDTQEKLRLVGIPPKKLNQKSITLTQDQLQLLVNLLAAELNDINLGLLAKPLHPRAIKLAYYCAINGESVGDAIEIFCEFFNSYENSLRYLFITESDFAYFRILPNSDKELVNNYPLVYWASIIYRMLCHMSEQRLTLKAASFNHAAPNYVSEYQFMFYNSLIHFNEKRTELIFPLATMHRPIVNRIKWDNSALTSELIISQFIVPHNLGPHIQTWLTRKLRLLKKMPSIEETSQHFAMTRQTMLRKLAKENTNFQEIKHRVWREAACQMLLESNRSVSEIALELGFSEAASFSRAFKRWTGFSPRGFRSAEQPGG